MRTLKILLPTDFSDNALHAIRYALRLFEGTDCVFFVLNAYQVSPSGLSSTIGKARDTRLYQVVKEQSKRQLYTLVDKLAKQYGTKRHRFEGLSISDSLLNAIGRNAIDHNIDYIVMGTKGSSALKEVFMGSNTVSVLKHIDFCPLLAVPEGCRLERPKKIVFATNFEHTYSEVELIPLLDLAMASKAKVEVVHIDTEHGLSEPQKNSRSLLKQRLSGVSNQFSEIKGQTGVADTIAHYIGNQEEIQMLAMINYWHSFFERLTREAVVKKITFSTEVPFLILPFVGQ